MNSSRRSLLSGISGLLASGTLGAAASQSQVSLSVPPAAATQGPLVILHTPRRLAPHQKQRAYDGLQAAGSRLGCRLFLADDVQGVEIAQEGAYSFYEKLGDYEVRISANSLDELRALMADYGPPSVRADSKPVFFRPASPEELEEVARRQRILEQGSWKPGDVFVTDQPYFKAIV